MGNLNHNSRTITGLIIGTLGTAMRHMLEYGKTAVDNRMMLTAVDFHYEADTAAIMFICGTI